MPVHNKQEYKRRAIPVPFSGARRLLAYAELVLRPRFPVELHPCLPPGYALKAGFDVFLKRFLLPV